MKHLVIFGLYYFWLAIRYFAISGLTYRWAKNGRHSYDKLRQGQIKKEIKHSLISFIVFSAIGVYMIYAIEHKIAKVYFDISEHGWLYLGLSIVGMLAIHDIYFYVTHRLMHEVKFLAKFHRIHHQSVSTNPFSAFSFHPIEALIATGAGIILLFIIPLHPLAFFVFQLIMVGFNVIGHLGFDIFPRRNRWISTGSVHELHHSRGRGNYGLYTTVWDTVFSTQISGTTIAK